MILNWIRKLKSGLSGRMTGKPVYSPFTGRGAGIASFGSDLKLLCSWLRTGIAAAVGLFLLAFIFTLSASPAWANVAANTQITNAAHLSYFNGVATRTVDASVVVTVSLVPAPLIIAVGPDQTTQYVGPASSRTDTFTITAGSNGPDTYDITASITVPPAGSTNTTGPGVVVNGPTSITLGASVTVAGSDGTNIRVPSDGNSSDNSVNGITANAWVVINNGQLRQVDHVIDNATGVSIIVLKVALPPASIPGAGVLVGEQKTITTTVTAGNITTPGTDVTVSDTLTATSQTLPHPAATSATAIKNTFTSSLANFAKYVRNVTTSAAGTGTAYSYNSINYYPAGVTAKPGDILEYILVSTNIGSGPVSTAVVTDVLPTSYVTLRANAYGSGKEVQYVPDSTIPATFSLFSAATGDDAAVYVTATLTVNVGGATPPIPPAAGGTIAAGKRVLVLYQVNVNNPAPGDKIVNNAQLSSPDIATKKSSVTVTATATSGVASFAKYVRNVTTSAAGTGTAYSYNSINYYPAGVTAKPGDILEYILVSTNIGSGTISSSVVTDVLPTTYVTLKANAYGSGKEVQYVPDSTVPATFSLFSAAAGDDAAVYITSTLTVNVGGATPPIPPAAGGTIAAGKRVLVLYQVNVNNPAPGDKIVNSAQLSSPDITPVTSSVTITATSGVANFAKYVRNVTTSAAGTGTAYSYNSINYYPAGVTAKPGDILEYILVSTNIGSGTISSSVVTDVLPTTYVTLKANAYGSGKEVRYVPDSTVPATFSLFSAAAGDDAAVYVTSTLTVNVGGATPPIPPAAGGAIAAGKSVLVLYQVNVNNPAPGGKIVNNAQLSSPDITPVTSAVTVTATTPTPSSVANFAKYVRNVTTSATGTGTAYSYNSINYYPAGVTAKLGDVLEYILVSTNSGSGPVSAAVVTDVLPTSYVSLKTGAYSGGTKDITYIDDAGIASYLTISGGTDACSWATPTLTINVGTGATSTAGGTIAAGRSVLVLYQVNVNTTAQGGKIANSAQLSSPDITSVKSSVTVTINIGFATLIKYVRNVTTSAVGTGSAYSYNSINYYPAGVTAKLGDVLEYILVSTNIGLGTVSAAVVTDVLPTSYVSLKTGAYSGGTKDITYIDDAGIASYLTVSSGTDAGSWATPTLTINVGTDATSTAGGTIAAGKSVLVLYQVNVNTTAQGDRIVNRARLYSPDITPVTKAVTVIAVVRTPSDIKILSYAPSLPAAELVNVSTTAYRAGSPTGSFENLPPPVPVGTTTPIDLSHPVPLTAATQFHQGEPLFIRLTDLDQNLDPTLAETVLVTISNTANSDVEIIRLTETGPNTGVFTGYLPTGSGHVTSYNGTLSVNAGDIITARYVDIADNSDTSMATVMVDPYGIVLDTSTGLPVSGATITMINAVTGLSAAVFGDDGISTFPATIISGGSASDSSGKTYSFPKGSFRFPFVLPGSYQYKVSPPKGYVSPSAVETAKIQALPGGPFRIELGSRGEVFVINPGPAMRIDIPVDSASSLGLQKASGKDSAGHGDFIPYRLIVTNSSTLFTTAGVRVTDTMPVGFRYKGGSFKLNGVSSGDPTISSDGRTLIFNVGTLTEGASATIDYVAEVTAGTRLGDAINNAFATAARGEKSINARVTVKIRDDFMRTESILMGRITTGACNNETGEGTNGVEGARVYLEDGSFVISDKRGLFHFEGVRLGLHVVQLDVDSLPEGYEAVSCTENSRFAGRSFSQFVETQVGTLWRTDFHVRSKKKPASETSSIVSPESASQSLKGEIILQLSNTTKGNNISYKAVMRGSTLPVRAARLNVILPEGVLYEPGSSMMDGVAIVDPQQMEKTRLIFKLGDLPAGWHSEITFRGKPSRDMKAGILATQAYLAADGGAKSEVLTPPAETILQLEKNEEISQMPGIVMRPRFPVRSAELNAEDRGKLDELAKSLAGLRMEKIQVIGYTDNIPIAPQNRIYYVDNQALSLARAKSVGHYLMNKLNLTPEKLFIEGRGSNAPIADNSTAEGRALNRRVELRIVSSHTVDSSRLSVLKELSGEKRIETVEPRKEDKKDTAPAGPKPASPEVPASAEPDKSEIKIKDPEGILYPTDKEILISNISSVRVCLNSKLTPRLLVDDKEVSAKRIGFTMKDEKADKAIYSYIGVDFGGRGNHIVQFQGVDPFGNARFNQIISVKRSGQIVSIRFKSAEGNVADGKTPVKLRLELYDADGTRIPAEAEMEIRDGTLNPLKQPDIFAAPPAAGSHPIVQMNREGDVLFQPVNNSGLYRVLLGYNNITVEAETYVQPQLREWILVGLAEGTAGYHTVSGNMENLQGADIDEKLYKDGRVALFAKGQIKGKWLLTMAYDSAKATGNDTNGLFQTINPDTYYTLYGDTSQQQYDAASAKKLYIKIERGQFYAMFGDYDTGLTVTELSHYSRRMTGVKTELQTKNIEVNAFASKTDQVYTRDEIPGDGTSGIYRLSRRNIVPNTEKITIEVRDRFRSEILVTSRALSRFSDYSIDYDAGTVIFKEPIYSRDEKFNPIMIVAEYETVSEGGNDYTYGGRAGVKLLDNKLKAGGSYIHEGQGDRNSNLYGVDASLKLDDKTKIRGEFAKSDYSAGSESRSGNAFLVEASRTDKKYDAKAYIREQEAGFGLGQQPGSEAGTRKFGVEGTYRFSEKFNASADIYRQYNLLADATRDMAEGKFGYTEKNYGASVGFLHANDSLGNDSKHESNQLTLGGKVLTLYDRLTLGLNHAQSIGSNDNSDFPTRTIMSAEFAVTKKLTLLAAQEFTWGSGANTQNTRLGMRYSPWNGADLNSSVERQFNENDDRVFANVGLKQTWQVNKAWKVDAGVERSQTVAKSEHYQFNTNVPPASGNVVSALGSHDDFTAVSGGATYQIEKLTWDNRLEFRWAESEDKWGLMSGLVKEIDSSWAWSGRVQLFQTSASTGIDTTKADLRYGLVYRPPQTKLIALNRFDLIIDKQSGSGSADYDSWRLINNLMLNYHPQKETQISLHYGAKYVQEKIYDSEYSGYTDLVGAEVRYDLTKDWDIGLHGSILHSWNASVFDYCSGLSVGYNVAQNAWLSLGYNLLGFQDKDFSQADFTAQGPFVRFRFKFDQNSVIDAAKWINGIGFSGGVNSELLTGKAK